MGVIRRNVMLGMLVGMGVTEFSSQIAKAVKEEM